MRPIVVAEGSEGVGVDGAEIDLPGVDDTVVGAGGMMVAAPTSAPAPAPAPAHVEAPAQVHASVLVLAAQQRAQHQHHRQPQQPGSYSEEGAEVIDRVVVEINDVEVQHMVARCTKLALELTQCWGPPRHYLYHGGVRTAISIVLLASCRLRALASATPQPTDVILPPELWLHVLTFFNRADWAVVQEKNWLA
jgi:hypothetical protein